MIVQYRRIYNEIRVGEWSDWKELGEFASVKNALETICDRLIEKLNLRFSKKLNLSEKKEMFDNFIDVSMDQIGIYEFENLSFDSSSFDSYQYRFIDELGENKFHQFTFKEDSPWKVGLNDLQTHIL
jgi:hypothetical protein